MFYDSKVLEALENFSRPWLGAMPCLCKHKFLLLVPILTSDRKETFRGVP